MIRLEKVSIQQGDFSLTEIDLAIRPHQYAILMGPTGSGKTTLVEAICGLRRVSSGRIRVNGRDVTHLPPAARQIGFVPQDAVLFPTLKVAQQISFPLKVRRTSKQDQNRRIGELAELLEIDSLLGRYPRGLSGGERQRVALARALSFRPQLLCLDEPLSSVDDPMRTKLGSLLQQVYQLEQVTVLHITHNAAEAKMLSSVQYRLNDGNIEQLVP